jgi:polysaccharide chain length determinant protein (PEP-CTERM system associated)
MTDGGQPGGGLERALAVWRRRKRLAVLAFAFPCAAALALVAALPSVYESTTTILVDRQQVPEEFVRSTVTSALEVRLQTISQEILSRSRLQALIDRFGLYAALRPQVSDEALVERMRQDVRLELVGAEAREAGRRDGRATVAFTVSYRGRDPRLVAQVTNTLASFYIEENLRARERQATGTAQFLKVQLDETKQRLDEQERRVSEFKKRYLGELPGQLQTNLAALQQFHEQLRANTLSQVRLAERKDLLQLQLQTVNASPEAALLASSPGAPVDPRVLRLARLRQELAELETRFTDRYPDVRRTRDDIASLERELAEAPPSGAAPAAGGAPAVSALTPAAGAATLRIRQSLAEADAEIRVLKEDEARLRAAIAAYDQRVANIPRREQEFQEVSRDYETTKELYASLLKRHEEAQLAESMEQRQKGEQFRILDPAVPAREPTAPRRPKLLVMGLVLAAGLAAGAVLLTEQRDTSFHTLDDLRAAVPVPVVATIPRLVTERDRRALRRRGALIGVATVAGLVLLIGAAWWLGHGNERLVWLVTRGKG